MIFQTLSLKYHCKLLEKNHESSFLVLSDAIWELKAVFFNSHTNLVKMGTPTQEYFDAQALVNNSENQYISIIFYAK